MSDAAQARAPQDGAPLAEVEGAAPLRVLLLEDSRFDAELLGEALRTQFPGVSLQWVADEDAFVAALAGQTFDLILSDYELQGFNGGHALDHARVLAPHAPFIFVSGVIGEDNAVELLKRGATDYVSKGRLARLPLVIDRAMREADQRRTIEEARGRLHEADVTFDSVVNTLRDYAVILLNTRGLIRSWNRAATDIFRMDASSVIGQPVAMLFVDEDRQAGIPQQELDIALAQGRASDDRWMRRADGVRLWVEGSVARLDGAGGVHTGFCKIMRDVTTSYEQAEAVREAKEQAERANRAKDRFLAVLSHELRTPLSPIASAAQILQKVAQVPEKYEGLLPMIERNVALEARLIEDLLDLTAISEGKLVLRKTDVDMNSLVLAVVEMVSDQAREKSLKVAADLCGGQALVLADEARMQQVLWNIVRNAIKFTPPGGRIELRTRIEDGHFQLTCKDSGIGIDAVALPRIFQAFHQADAEVSRTFGGLGLGLAIAQGLAREHDGQLTASSVGRGQGATFTLSVPLAQPGRDVVDGLQAQRQQETGAGQRVLIVEDNLDAADALMLSLEVFGYTVRCARSCSEALEMARRESFDAVVTDLGLPDGSGLQIGAALRGVLPVVALSGYGAPNDVKRSTEAGFAAHLVKPADPSTVHATLQKVMTPGHHV